MLSMKNNPLASLNGLFYPESIAVVGASNNLSKIGGFIFSQLKFVKSCHLYPINVKEEEVQGVKAYSSITELRKKVDLAIIAIPSQFVVKSVEECAKKGITNIVIISAGFKEVGEEGRKREEELKQIISKHKLNVVGPNCLGVLNTHNTLNASFAKEIPNKGDIGLVSQSGAIIDALLDWSFEHNIGFSKVVSIGNMAGVDELDMLRYLRQDPKTSSIVFYMESLENGEAFAKELKETSKKKPVVIIKPGNSKQAQKAIGSHTGSLAQDSILVETLIKQNNGIFVKTLDELYDTLIGLSSPNPYPHNNSVAIVTNAGGPGVIATDMVENTTLQLAEINANLKNTISKKIPQEASLNNPIDVLGDATSNRYHIVVEQLAKNSSVGAIIVLLTPQIMTDSPEIAKEVVKVSKTSKKPIFTAFLGGKELRESFEILKEHHIANFSSPHKAIETLDKMYQYKIFDYSKKLQPPRVNSNTIKKLRNQIKQKEGLLSYSFSKKILSCVGISLPHKQIFETRDEILSTTLPSHRDYVLKAEGILHKKEQGAIVNNITSLNFYDEALSMFSRVEKKGVSPILTLEESVSGYEIIIGLKSHGSLGSFIMVGSGGTGVSIYNDIVFSQAPLNKQQAKTLISKTAISKLLYGYRGDSPVDVDSLIDMITRISYLQELFPEITEIDCNPVICNKKGCFFVDVKLVLPKNNEKSNEY